MNETPEPIAQPEKIPETLLGALGISSPRRILLFLLCFAVSLAIAVSLPATGLSPAGRRALFMLLFAGSLWVTEAIPAFAVGILVIGLQVFLLGRPGGVFAQSSRDWEQFVAVLGHPLVWLFFGGFVLAAGMECSGLDRRLARGLLVRIGDRPTAVLLGVMVATFVLSMFMSNTATTAMMLATIAPLLATLDGDDPFGPGLLLGVAVASNLGGMGSLIGTPPNAIAVGALADLPEPKGITFLEWMAVGLPLALALLALAWAVIARLYRPGAARLRLDGLVAQPRAEPGEDEPAWETLVVAGTMAVTVGLWLTSQWHPLPTAVVSFVPIVVLTTTGVLGVREIRSPSPPQARCSGSG